MIKQFKDSIFFYLLPLLVVIIYCSVKSVFAPIGDFANYYYGSKFLIEGKSDSWIYNPAQFNLKVYESGLRNFFLNYTPVPPLSVLVYTPFSFFDVHLSKFIFNILSSSLFCCTAIRMIRHLKLPKYLLLAIPVLFFGPIQSNLFQGQGYFIILFLLTEGFLQHEKGNKFIGLSLWALAIHLKITPAIVLFYLLFQKDFKSATYLFIAIGTYYLVSLPFIGNDDWYAYLFYVVPRIFSGEINNTYALSYQSMQVLLKNLLVPDLMHNPSALFNKPELYAHLLSAYKIIILSIGVYFSISKINTIAKFSIWLIIGILVSGYGTTYGLIILLLPITVLYNNSPKTVGYLLPIIILSIVIMNVPFYWYSNLTLWAKFFRLYALLALLLINLLIFKPHIRWYWAILPMIFILIPKTKSDYPQNYLFRQEEALLIYNFTVIKNGIIINYYDNVGPQTKRIPLDITISSVVYPNRNNRFKNKFCNHKQAIINDSLSIYLSDKNRGIGFTTLRVNILK